MAWMSQGESHCATCAYQKNCPNEQICKDCKILGVGQLPSNYKPNNNKGKKDNTISHDMSDYSDKELIGELEKRGYAVTKR